MLSSSRRPLLARRVVASVTALAGLGLTAVALPGPARADEVAVAQARVDTLQALVRTTTRTLTEGTRKWEADQASLRRVSLRLSNTQRHVKETEAVAAEGQARIDAIGRRLYMNPTQTQVGLTVVQSPDRFLTQLQVRDALDKVAGADDVVVQKAQTSRHRLRQQEAEVRQLSEDAQGLVDRSAKRLEQLDALAQSTADKLVAAQDALQGARARKAAAQAARAAARRQARDRAARSRAISSGGAACTGRSTGGQANGNLDPASLCPLWMAPGHRLRGDAAAAFNRLSKHHAATVGGPLCVTDSYRSYSEQVSVYRRKPGLAAVPGSSEHGWGKAVDFCGGIQDSGSDAYAWMKANAGSFGWYHPDWAEPSGNRPEPWHWEFGG